MNIDTGRIETMPANFTEADALMRRLIPVEASQMTEKQRANQQVSLHDTRSELGKLLHASRSCYQPHVGAKQLAKMAAKTAATK